MDLKKVRLIEAESGTVAASGGEAGRGDVSHGVKWQLRGLSLSRELRQHVDRREGSRMKAGCSLRECILVHLPHLRTSTHTVTVWGWACSSA